MFLLGLISDSIYVLDISGIDVKDQGNKDHSHGLSETFLPTSVKG